MRGGKDFERRYIVSHPGTWEGEPAGESQQDRPANCMADWDSLFSREETHALYQSNLRHTSESGIHSSIVPVS